MARAIRRIVVPTLLATFLMPALLLQTAFGVLLRGGIAVEGGADGFPGVEIATASRFDACLERGGSWGVTAPGQSPGPDWGSIPGAADGGIEAPIPVSVDDATAEVGEAEVSPPRVAAWSDMASCGAGGGYAGWPVAELPVWTPFGGAALDGGVAGGAVWVGALPSNAFWPFWPGTGTFTPAIFTPAIFTPATFTPATFTPATFMPGSVIERKLASPANGDNGDGGNGTTPVDDVILVMGEPTPGQASGVTVIPEPGMLFLLGMAMVALGLLRRDWA